MTGLYLALAAAAIVLLVMIAGAAKDAVGHLLAIRSMLNTIHQQQLGDSVLIDTAGEAVAALSTQILSVEIVQPSDD